MSLSSCPKCWDDLCTCGYQYSTWNKSQLIEMRDMFQQLIDGTHQYSIKSPTITAELQAEIDKEFPKVSPDAKPIKIGGFFRYSNTDLLNNDPMGLQQYTKGKQENK